MVDDPDYIPSSCKHGLTLNAVQEVRESEDFITLNMQLEAEIAQQQRTNASFALRVYGMNRRAHQRRYKNTFCKLLPAAACVFLAQFGVEFYGGHQVVMDLLAMHSDEMLSPLNITLVDFLVMYREANELAILPSPTVLNNIYHVIDVVNGPRPGEEPPTAAAASAAGSAPAAAAPAAGGGGGPPASNQTENQLVLQSDAPEFQVELSPTNNTTGDAAEAPPPSPPPPHDSTPLAIAAADNPLRTTSEHNTFGKVMNLNALSGCKRKMSLFDSSSCAWDYTSSVWEVQVLLANIHTCLYGSMLELATGIEPPTVSEYLHSANNKLYDHV